MCLPRAYVLKPWFKAIGFPGSGRARSGAAERKAGNRGHTGPYVFSVPRREISRRLRGLIPPTNQTTSWKKTSRATIYGLKIEL